MKEILSLTKIRQIKMYNNIVYFHMGNWNVYAMNESNANLILEEKVSNFIQYNNIIYYRLREIKNEIYSFSNNKKKKVLIAGNDESVSLSDSCLINSKIPISIKKNGDFMPCGMYLIDINDNIEKYNKYYRFDVMVKDIYFNYIKTMVLAYSNKFNLIYKKTITEYGRNIVKHPKTGAVLWDKPNEIKEALLADDKNIYVPLTGGQLLALDAETGEIVWMWEHPRSGTFAIQGEYIYKQDGLSIFEIDTKTGKLIRKKNFNDDVLVEEFHASGPLWVYDDIIIVCDVLYGKICLLNRQTLEVEEFFSLNNKLVNSKDAIIWNDNKLYVLDIDRTLHIFEK